jgi:hypothetical protein
LGEALEKLVVNPVKSAIAEDNDDVSRSYQRRQPIDDVASSRFVEGGLSCGDDVGDNTFGVESLSFGNLFDAGDTRKKDTVGLSKALGKLMLEDGATRGVRQLS